MTKIEKVTAETLALDVEYKPYPGLKYEIAPGVVGSLKSPVRSLRIKAEAANDANDTNEEIDGDLVFKNKCEIADLVLDLPGGQSVVALFDSGSIFENVVLNAVFDFFTVAMPRPGRHLRSFVLSQQPKQNATLEDEQ